MIEFNSENKIFKIQTKNTLYAMQIVHDKYLAHLYYGSKIDDVTVGYQEIPVAFASYVADVGSVFSLDTILTELSFFDSGDSRDTAIKIKNQNGDSTTLFYYKSHRVFKGRCDFLDMPYSRNADETLEIVYVDEVSGCELYSYYSVFYESDTITRYAKFMNCGKASLQICQANIAQLDFYGGEYKVVTLCGDYNQERQINEHLIHAGIQGIYSKRGHSSHHYNPFIALKGVETTENAGDAYAMEFVYSGDFEGRVEKCFDGRIRVMLGLNRDTFSWLLKEDEEFWTPEVIMTYSARGMNGLSQNLHDHIRGHIINQKFVNSARPIVINTWEAMYFNIDEEILFSYAEKARKIGIDTLVIDDGWFGSRNDDTSGLGEWYVNVNKFKNGLQFFSEKVHNLGLKLGIWIEPEMVNPKSELYKKHPEWVLQCKDRPSSLSRKQLVLDLTNDEVIDYVVDGLKETFKGVQLEYIKWDFNRSLSEAGSLFLPMERQSEAKHRFVLGSYKMHKKLTEAFPDVLFEGCSGGGGRFDAGLLFYCPQIWTSDNTDPVSRLAIQKGTSLAYPISSISAHISDTLCNNVENIADYDFRFNVSLGGVLGYELNILKLSKENEERVKAQVEKNRKLQPLLLAGDYYRFDGFEQGEFGFACIAKDKSEFIVVYQNLNKTANKTITVNGLDEKTLYKNEKGDVYTGEKIHRQGIELELIDGLYAFDYFQRVKNS